MNFDFLLRYSTLLIFIITRAYWFFKKNSKEKNIKNSFYVEKIIKVIGAFYIGLNLLGFTILRFNNFKVQFLGFIFVIIGNLIAIIGRKTLANNWTTSHDFKIKKNHKLINFGIYKYLRHPIYAGFLIAITGAFMVSKTLLFIPYFFIIFIMMNILAEREEKILKKHFGIKYFLYIKKTKKFFLFIY